MIKRIILVTIVCLTLAACSSPDSDTMKRGLIKSGLNSDQAQCYAEIFEYSLDTDHYNTLAVLLDAGESTDAAIRRVGRRYGASFRTDIKEAKVDLAACL